MLEVSCHNLESLFQDKASCFLAPTFFWGGGIFEDFVVVVNTQLVENPKGYREKRWSFTPNLFPHLLNNLMRSVLRNLILQTVNEATNHLFLLKAMGYEPNSRKPFFAFLLLPVMRLFLFCSTDAQNIKE